MLCSPSTSVSDACSFRIDGPRCLAEALAACFLIRIRDAGVAGSSLFSIVEAALEPCCFARIDGELLVALDLGVAGGGIRTSDKDSGEMDSASELSWLYGKGCFPAFTDGLMPPLVF